MVVSVGSQRLSRPSLRTRLGNGIGRAHSLASARKAARSTAASRSASQPFREPRNPCASVLGGMWMGTLQSRILQTGAEEEPDDGTRSGRGWGTPDVQARYSVPLVIDMVHLYTPAPCAHPMGQLGVDLACACDPSIARLSRCNTAPCSAKGSRSLLHDIPCISQTPTRANTTDTHRCRQVCSYHSVYPVTCENTRAD